MLLFMHKIKHDDVIKNSYTETKNKYNKKAAKITFILPYQAGNVTSWKNELC